MHIPVLKEEAIKFLEIKQNDNYIDATCGRGGHLIAILENNGPKGKVMAIDQSPEQIQECRLKTKNFGKRIVLVNDNFSNLFEIVKQEKFGLVRGILFDLGLSSWHLEESKRGFSFLRKEPLDMRYDPTGQLTAEKIVNYWSRADLIKILEEYGEEKFATAIAESIIAARQKKPLENTWQLVEAIEIALPRFYKRQRIHFATKTFQALRIAVNDELAVLEKALSQSLKILDKEGRLVVISFHSLEDRIVKNFFKKEAGQGNLQILTKKPLTASFLEIKQNPRARSAKLRAALKIIIKE
jgi:16S rRNA (cytosine1402-N4)-methyltransferase